MFMSENVICLGKTPFAKKHWRSLGRFSESLWRQLSPEMFLRAHRYQDGTDQLLRQALFMVTALGAEPPDHQACRTGFDKLPYLRPDMAVEEALRFLGVPAQLSDLLQRCGHEALEAESYRHLARWSGWTGPEDSLRVQRLLEHETLSSQIIAVLARAPDDLYPMLAGRSSEDVDLLIQVLPDLIPALPLFPEDARRFLRDRLCHAGGRQLIEHIRDVMSGMRKSGSFRAPPSFSDSRFCVIAHPAATVQHLALDESVVERLLFEHAFLVGFRGEKCSPTFVAFALLEAVHAADQAPAGFLLNPVIRNREGEAADDELAAVVRERLIRCASGPVFLHPASVGATGLERRLMQRDYFREVWN